MSSHIRAKLNRFGIRATVSLVAAIFLLSQAGTADDEPPIVVTPRRPRTDAQLRYWLGNMIWHHRYSTAEVAEATGMSAGAIEAARKKFDIRSDNLPPRTTEGLLVLPYPGGRHPRIGFLEGAIDPQRETKVSVFTPWHTVDEPSYVVVDCPEAIWSNLGLTYLAHTHIDTIWSAKGIELPVQEWERGKEGRLTSTRRLPNGIEFTAEVTPHRDHVAMRLSLTNGTDAALSDLRVQNCVMLKAAPGFEGQTNDNKRGIGAYACVHDESKERWIITAWKPLHRTWFNERCPCLHSDPKFADCEPGESAELRGVAVVLRRCGHRSGGGADRSPRVVAGQSGRAPVVPAASLHSKRNRITNRNDDRHPRQPPVRQRERRCCTQTTAWTRPRREEGPLRRTKPGSRDSHGRRKASRRAAIRLSQRRLVAV